jgi:CBS domain-containing protein
MADVRDPMRVTAADVMTSGPRTCSTFSTVLEAVMIFRDADCGAVPVLEDGKPVGILTDRDVAMALADHPDLVSRPVADVMTRGVISVTPNATLEAIRQKFGQHGVRRLLVVDPTDRLVGIIAWADVAQYLADCQLGEVVTEVVQQPPAPVSAATPVGPTS